MIAPLAVTPGEPAGIGPDLCVRLAQQAAGGVPMVVIADPELLVERAARLALPLRVRTVDADHAPTAHVAGTLNVLPVPRAAPTACGRPDPANARYVLATLERAVDGCLDGTFSAMVTGPVHKGVINDAGVPFTGHTEFIAARSGGHPVMMLACPGLRVALVTTHLPLRAVADAITPARLETVLRILDADLRRRFGIAQPDIRVCGLNPHAGEDGHLGREEIDVIAPVLARLRDAIPGLSGPYPADTLFTPHGLAGADAVLAMYHDQGLPVLKHLGFGEAVNITLGLPLVRTSVDHGTALSLAGTGDARDASLRAALAQAARMAGFPAHERSGQAAPG